MRTPPRVSADQDEAGTPILTPTLFCFLLYILVITSYRLPLGDVAMGGALVGLLFQRQALRLPSTLGLLAGFVLWCFVSATRSSFVDVANAQALELIKIWLIALVAVNALRSERQIRVYMIGFLLCFALFPLRGAFFNYYLYGSTAFGRAIWVNLYENPNDLAAIALLQLSMAVALYTVEQRRWLRAGLGAGALLLILLVLLTQSRAALLGLVAFGLLAIMVQRRRLRMLAQVAILGGIVLIVAPSGILERARGLRNVTDTTRLAEVDEEGSAQQRFEIWRVAFDIIGDHPLMGVGTGVYPLEHSRYALREKFRPTARGRRDTHSMYFNVLAESGYPGLLLLLGVIGTAVACAERARRRIRDAFPANARQLFLLELGLVAFLVAGIFGSFAYLPFLYLHLALLIAIALAYAQRATAVSAASVSEPLRPATARRSGRRG